MVVRRTHPQNKTAQAGNAPPYISFGLFVQFLDALHAFLQQHGDLPQQLDKAFWEEYFNNSQWPQIMAALRFLHLIEPNTSRPAHVLKRLAEPTQRKTALREVLETHYSKMLPLTQRPEVSRKDLYTWFQAWYRGVSDSTRRKGVTFLLTAAQYADMPVASGLSRSTDVEADNPSHIGTSLGDNPPQAVLLPLPADGSENIERPTDGQNGHGASYAPQEVFDVSPGHLAIADEGGSSAASLAVLKVISTLSRDLYAHPEWSDERRALWSKTITDSTEVLGRIILEATQGDKTTGARPATNGYMRP